MKNVVCFFLSIVLSTAVTANDGADAHNDVRFKLNAGNYFSQPVPSPALGPLQWDETIAARAQVRSDQCIWGHTTSSERGGDGENIYLSGRTSTVRDAVISWADGEVKYYDYTTHKCSNVCGHYTQAVWQSTKKVGCGVSSCPVMSGVGFGGTYIVCQYNPPGNYNGIRPYLQNVVADGTNLIGNTLVIDQLIVAGLAYKVKLLEVNSQLTITDFSLVGYDGSKQLSEAYSIFDNSTAVYIPRIEFNGLNYWMQLLHISNSLTFNILNLGENK
jgi:hypothetical protein